MAALNSPVTPPNILCGIQVFVFFNIAPVFLRNFAPFGSVFHSSNDNIAQQSSPKRAGLLMPQRCEGCQRSSRTETVETDSFLSHTKGKNESM